MVSKRKSKKVVRKSKKVVRKSKKVVRKSKKVVRKRKTTSRGGLGFSDNKMREIKDKYRILHPNFDILKKTPRLYNAYLNDENKFLESFYDRYIRFDLPLEYSLSETEKEFS